MNHNKASDFDFLIIIPEKFIEFDNDLDGVLGKYMFLYSDTLPLLPSTLTVNLIIMLSI